jgi:hypothetical protein
LDRGFGYDERWSSGNGLSTTWRDVHGILTITLPHADGSDIEFVYLFTLSANSKIASDSQFIEVMKAFCLSIFSWFAFGLPVNYLIYGAFLHVEMKHHDRQRVIWELV